MRRRFAGSVESLAWWCSIICAKACSRPIFTSPRSIPCTVTCCSTTASQRFHAECRTRTAKAKWNPVLATRRGRRSKANAFESLEDAQAYLDRWEARWADTLIHGTTKRQVATMFAEEHPALLPLPLEPFRYYQYGERAVHLDGCVEVEAAYYGAPPGWIGRRVQVQWNDAHVRLLNPTTGQLLREHLRQERGRHRIHDEDHPRRTPLSTQQLLHRAGKAGRHIGQLCQALHRKHGEVAVRRILGVLALAKKYGIA